MPDMDMRDAYCLALKELAADNKNIVALDADLMGADGLSSFKKEFPDQFINVGVAEANMVGIASGLSTMGKIPFASSFACFASRRVYDQFFISSNYAGLKVNLTGSDPGISAQLNGGTHMAFEDIGIMRNTPNLVIYEPCDIVSMKALVKEAAKIPNCTYLRLHRKGSNTIYDQNETFELGKGKVLRDGTDLTIIATGYILVPEALKAAEALSAKGIEAAVIDGYSIKPFDEDLVLEYAKKTGAVLTCENHQAATGLGSAVATFLSAKHPVPVFTHGVKDVFGEVGGMDYLKKKFGFTAERITELAEALIKEK
ncbi:MAG: transketolase family protein [Spirochaetales bacterium]|nr:transketolase family protein [Spirochaetales bacterium]